jgi:hypothetical protein
MKKIQNAKNAKMRRKIEKREGMKKEISEKTEVRKRELSRMRFANLRVSIQR